MNWINWLFPPKAAIVESNQPEPGESAKPSEDERVLDLIRDYFESKGGLQRVVKLFEESGFVGKVRSWVSTGPNQPINSVEALQLVGWPGILEMAKKADFSVDNLRERLAKLLPIAIDRATPEGKL
ncbi:MAG TPA: YidB family protein [Methylocystis sp.]|nr:YidB family protein [Methylocystis sp.]